MSKNWSPLVLKPYLASNTKVNEEELLVASKLGEFRGCEYANLTGENASKLEGEVSYTSFCKFEHGEGLVRIMAKFSKNGESSEILIFQVNPF